MSIWNFKFKTYHFPAPFQFYLLCQDCDQEQQIQTPMEADMSCSATEISWLQDTSGLAVMRGRKSLWRIPWAGRRVDPDGPASWLAHNTIPPSITQKTGALWCHILSCWSSAWGGYNVLLSIEAHLVKACTRRETTWHLRYCRLAWVSLQKFKTACSELTGLDWARLSSLVPYAMRSSMQYTLK